MAQEKLFGYAGKILHVDLSEGAVRSIPVTRELIDKYLGGFGFTAKLVYDFVRPGVDPLSPANPFIMGAPVLGGTFAPCGGRTVLMGKSPLSGLIGISHIGDPGAMLKFAGYDQIVVTGRAAKPSYIKVCNENVEIISADHIWGSTIPETVDAIWRDLGPDFYVTCIGQAGENLVKFASVMTNKYSTAGKCGLGAVMGSKNLKAIAIFGDKAVEVAHPGRFTRICREVFDKIIKNPKVPLHREYGSAAYFQGDDARGCFIRRYHSDGTPVELSEVFDSEQFRQRIRARNITCFGCPIGCKQELKLKQGEFAGSDFGVSCTAGTMSIPFSYQLSVDRWEDVAKCAEVNNSYGMDALAIGSMIALLIDMQREEVISTKDTGGKPLDWGDAKQIMELVRKTAFREGVGDLLAEGPIAMCRKLGLNPEDHVIHCKGLPLYPTMDARKDFGPQILGACVNPRGPGSDYHRPVRLLLKHEHPDFSAEYLEKVCKTMGVSDEEMDKVVTREGHWLCNIAQISRYVEDYSIVFYCLGTCDRDYVNPDVYNMETYVELFSALTGIEMSSQDLLQVGERVWNLQRLFNTREGASRKDDQLPKLMYTTTLKTVLRDYPPCDVEAFNRSLDEYYSIRGWDKRGIPTKAKLAELGL